MTSGPDSQNDNCPRLSYKIENRPRKLIDVSSEKWVGPSVGRAQTAKCLLILKEGGKEGRMEGGGGRKTNWHRNLSSPLRIAHSLTPDQFRLRVKTQSKKRTMGYCRPLHWQPRSRSIISFFLSYLLIPAEENHSPQKVCRKEKGNKQDILL